jgi:segregation and condensation protein B
MQEERTEPTDAQTPDTETVETEAAEQEVEQAEETTPAQDEVVAEQVDEQAAEDVQTEDTEAEADDEPVEADAADDDQPQEAQAEQTDEAEPVAEDIEDNEDDAEEQDTEVPEDFTASLETVIESVLFASDEPLSPKRLVDVAEAGSVKDVNKCVKSLNKAYRESGRAFRIEKISGGYQLMTLSIFNPWISKLIKVRSDNKLTPAALETLAIVAYKQPMIRADVEAIRGVASGEVLRNLMYKGLVKIVGRAEILGRPMLYGTTKKFLDVFGLANLKDLPKIEELKKPE